MANKRYNHQTTTLFKKGVPPDGNEHGTAMKKPLGTSPDVMPGLPGKTGSYPAKSGPFVLVKTHPEEQGLG